MKERHGLLGLSLCALVVVIVAFTHSQLSAAPLPSTDVVISQVYGGGGNSGATYKNDFVELFNRGTTTVTLNGWSIQYASATASAWSVTLLSGTIAPGHFYLIQQAAGAGGTTALPTPQVISTTSMSSGSGKVALVKSTTALSGTCPLTNTNLVDFIGYGTGASGANCFEGTGAITGPSDNIKAVFRQMNGCTDTDNNSADLFTASAAPRNSSFATSCSTVTEHLLIVEVLYDGMMTDDGDELIKLVNPLSYTVYIDNYKIGDGEGMYQFPFGTSLAPGQFIVIARNAEQFKARFGFYPNYEMVPTGTNLTDAPSVPNLTKLTSSSIALSNSGDEVMLLGPGDQIADSVAWEGGSFVSVGLTGTASANEPMSLQRYNMQDTNNMTFDFFHGNTNPGILVMPPSPPLSNPGRAMGSGMFAYWGDLHSHSTVSDGSGPPRMAFATARANGLHFFGLTDHDWWTTPDEWTEIGNAADAANVDNLFIALRGFEYTQSDGHISVFGLNNYIIGKDPAYDTLAEFYAWMASQPNVIAQFNHPTWQYGGDFKNLGFDSSGAKGMGMIEVGNNGGAQYLTFESQYLLALRNGWHVAPTNNSDNHKLDWGADSKHRAGVIAPSLTRASVLDAFRARRVFATEDANLVIALQANGAWMGSTIRNQLDINWVVTVSDPDPEPIQLALFDNGTIVRTQSFSTSNVMWNVTLNGTPEHYYLVRAIQQDGNTAYTAPIWTDKTPLPTGVPLPGEPKENKKFLGPSSAETAHATGVGMVLDLEACVTVPPGVFSDRYIYLQDHTGGIRVYMATKTGDFPAMQLNDRVAIRGRTQGTTAERELVIEDVSTIQLRGTCASIVPASLSTGSVDKTDEGLLVQVQGIIKSIDQYELILDDGSGEVLVYVDITTKVRLSNLARGQTIRVTGVVSRVHSRPTILPRYDTDIVPVNVPAPARTNTPIRRTPSPMPTRTATRVSANPTLTPTVTATSTLRAFLHTTPEPAQANVSRFDAQSAAVVGGSGSIVASFVFFGLAALLARRK